MGEQPAPRVKKVVLPSGRTIEVVLFPDRDGGGGHPPAEPGHDLHVCRSCLSPLVYPLDWAQAGPGHWSVVLVCPNCGHEREGVFSEAAVEFFDELLDEGAAALARDLSRLEHANFREEIGRFVAALKADALLPEDF